LVASGKLQPGSGFPDLHAPETDVKLMASLLNWRLGFPRANIHIVGLPRGAAGEGYVYGDRYATVGAIRRSMAWLGKKLSRSGHGVFYYSGHGTKVYDITRTKPDREDDALVPYDARDGGYVRDREINAWLRRDVRAARLSLIVDACYSGGMAKTVARGLGHAKFVTSAAAKSLGAYQPRPSANGEAMLPAGTPYLLFAACSRQEVADEIRHVGSPGVSVSAFTLALHNVMCWDPRDLTYRELLDAVTNRLRRMRRAQTPSLQGGSPRWTAIAPRTARRSGPCIPIAFRGSEAGGLPVGSLAGVRPGWVFACTRGTEAPTPTSALLRITRCDPLSSSGTWVRTASARPAFAVPRLVPNFGYAPIRVAVAMKGGALPMRRIAGFEFVEDEDEADMYLEVRPQQGAAELRRPDNRNPIRIVSDSPEGLGAAIEKALSDVLAPLRLQGLDAPGRTFGLRMGSNKGDAPSYAIGENIQLRITTTRTGYLILLALEPDGRIHIVFPNEFERDGRITPMSALTFPSPAMGFDLKAVEPGGDTTVVAILSARPMRLPDGTAGERTSGTVGSDRGAGFVDWLKQRLAASGAGVEMAQMVVRVESGVGP
jgi:hypothetical protein